MIENEPLVPEPVERPSDVADQASLMEEETFRHAMLEHARKMRRDQEIGPDGLWPTEDCDECGCEIGEGRLTKSIRNRLCIHCATLEERGKRR